MLQTHTAGGTGGIHGNGFSGPLVILSVFRVAPVQMFRERDSCDPLIFRMNVPALVLNRVSTYHMRMICVAANCPHLKLLLMENLEIETKKSKFRIMQMYTQSCGAKVDMVFIVVNLYLILFNQMCCVLCVLFCSALSNSIQLT